MHPRVESVEPASCLRRVSVAHTGRQRAWHYPWTLGPGRAEGGLHPRTVNPVELPSLLSCWLKTPALPCERILRQLFLLGKEDSLVLSGSCCIWRHARRAIDCHSCTGIEASPVFILPYERETQIVLNVYN